MRTVILALILASLISISGVITETIGAEVSIQEEDGSRTFECSTDAILFTSPDSSYRVLMDFLNDTHSELMIATYQFNCQVIAERVSTLAYEGINVTVTVDGSPVEGISASTLSALTRVRNSGGRTLTIDDSNSPFRHFHGKYMIRDGSTVLITSENLGQNGFSREPSYGNRGWGAIITCTDLADYYSEIYLADLKYASPEDTDVFVEGGEPFHGYYRPEFDKTTVSGEFQFIPVHAPETSHELIDMIKRAEESIYVQQFYIRPWGEEPNGIVEALKEASLRGVDVKVQMDSTWYHRDQNQEMADEINVFAEENDVKLEARLVEYRHGFQTVHNKGMVVDEREVLICSINWNANSYFNNREIGVIIHNEFAGRYFSEVFLSDWRILPNHPIADAGSDISVEVNQVVELYGGYSWNSANITSYRWDLTGDGRYDAEGTSVRWTYLSPGTYEVTLKVTDFEGQSDTDTITINVTNSENPGDNSLNLWMFLPVLIVFFLWLAKVVVET